MSDEKEAPNQLTDAEIAFAVMAAYHRLLDMVAPSTENPSRFRTSVAGALFLGALMEVKAQPERADELRDFIAKAISRLELIRDARSTEEAMDFFVKNAEDWMFEQVPVSGPKH
jgi:hypothetical protein